MTYNTNLQQNNAALAEILEMAEALPDAGTGGITEETDPTVYNFAKKELFDKADLQDPGEQNSFVTVDGVEYYRYHAGQSYGFVWENPSPKVGSVTITARLVNQYSPNTYDASRLLVHYSDGTTEQFWAMKAEPQTFVTNAAKTFVKLTGNYDLENWVLMDLSVMSAVASYFKGLPNPLTFTGAVEATYDGSAPMTVDIPAGGGGGWKLLGDITLEESEVKQVDFTEDMDGNPLSYESVHIVVFGVASQASGWVANIACSTHPNYQDVHQNFALAGNCLSTTGVWGAVTIEHISGGDWKAKSVKFALSAAASGAVQTYDGLGRTAYANWQAKPDGPIRKVRITPFAGTFSSGFRAILYGR